ncbi:hypothetical protein SPFM20_00018 [Salmonella phage SPFM20]|nr:hypothetical protein SPFM20_00018 [Salmonella phage SPFM20]
MPKPLQLEGLASLYGRKWLRWDGTIASHEEIGLTVTFQLAELLGAKVECHPNVNPATDDGN